MLRFPFTFNSSFPPLHHTPTPPQSAQNNAGSWAWFIISLLTATPHPGSPSITFANIAGGGIPPVFGLFNHSLFHLEIYWTFPQNPFFLFKQVGKNCAKMSIILIKITSDLFPLPQISCKEPKGVEQG